MKLYALVLLQIADLLHFLQTQISVILSVVVPVLERFALEDASYMCGSFHVDVTCQFLLCVSVLLGTPIYIVQCISRLND
jgi:hypothetical protein